MAQFNPLSLAGGQTPWQKGLGGAANTLSTLGLPMSFLFPKTGAIASVLGVGGNLASGLAFNKANIAAGQKKLNIAKKGFNAAISKNPNLYSSKGLRDAYFGISKANQQTSMLQRHNVSQAMRSGQNIANLKRATTKATSGASNMAMLQNQRTANKALTGIDNRANQQNAELMLRKTKDLSSREALISNRKRNLAKEQLLGAGIFNNAAIAGLRRKVTGY